MNGTNQKEIEMLLGDKQRKLGQVSFQTTFHLFCILNLDCILKIFSNKFSMHNFLSVFNLFVSCSSLFHLVPQLNSVH